ncbi:hypothetical protein AGR7C_Lc140066 [Agrobacterium deltaense Zutra 3/1]|uniref:Uncharacterized protein n=1 Tax=Agrobacterium deltaense Zutra 3/1 TaxID=1183427 RepID=A0A1S7R9M1_9HYPH|nr:hypothetical protein AGR7C_Lc140066 [Agrobacterium deltaense Zutra 3/1]
MHYSVICLPDAIGSDVHYRLIDEVDVTSPIILNHRVGDNSTHIDLIKRLIREMYAENPPWLDIERIHCERPTRI